MQVRLPHRLSRTSSRQELLENIYAIMDVLQHGIETENIGYGGAAATAGIAFKDASGTNIPHNLATNHSIEPVVTCVTTVNTTLSAYNTDGHTNVGESAVFLFASSAWSESNGGGGGVASMALRGRRLASAGTVAFHTHALAAAPARPESEQFYTAPAATGYAGLDGIYANFVDAALSVTFSGVPGAAITACAAQWVKRHVTRTI